MTEQERLLNRWWAAEVALMRLCEKLDAADTAAHAHLTPVADRLNDECTRRYEALKGYENGR